MTRLQCQYLILPDLLTAHGAAAIGSFIRGENRWRRYEEYYVDWDCHTNEVTTQLPAIEELTVLRETGAAAIERNFGVVVGRHYKIAGHKMLTGEAVSIHNDSPTGTRGRAALFRLLYYPAERELHTGGDLLLYDDARVLRRRWPAEFNTAVLLHLSDNAFHAVSEVERGVRYSVVVSYWAYPLLVRSTVSARVAGRCLRRLISAGLEEKRFEDTTLARHLYRTYALLARAGAPFHVCLAGLMYGVLESNNLGTPETDIGESEVAELVGEQAFAVICALRTSRSSCSARDDQSAAMVSQARMAERAGSEVQ